VVHPLVWFICLLGCGSLHFVPCFSLLWGALVNLWLTGFHHLRCFLNVNGKAKVWHTPCWFQ
jgi:hypothetical protein